MKDNEVSKEKLLDSVTVLFSAAGSGRNSFHRALEDYQFYFTEIIDPDQIYPHLYKVVQKNKSEEREKKGEDPRSIKALCLISDILGLDLLGTNLIKTNSELDEEKSDLGPVDKLVEELCACYRGENKESKPALANDIRIVILKGWSKSLGLRFEREGLQHPMLVKYNQLSLLEAIDLELNLIEALEQRIRGNELLKDKLLVIDTSFYSPSSLKDRIRWDIIPNGDKLLIEDAKNYNLHYLDNILEKQVRPFAAVPSANILMCGPDGCGKKMAAFAIHKASEDRGKGFTVVDFNMLIHPETKVLEIPAKTREAASEEVRTYLEQQIEEVGGGTVFFDNIDALDKTERSGLLLKILEQRSKGIWQGVRIIVAVNQTYDEMMTDEELRELSRYFNLRIDIPPLSAISHEEIEGLITYILDDLAARLGKQIQLKDGLKERLAKFRWDRNIAELDDTLDAAFRRSYRENPTAVPIIIETLGDVETRLQVASVVDRLRMMLDTIPENHEELKRLLDRSREIIDLNLLLPFEYNFYKHHLDEEGGKVAPAAERIGVSTQLIYKRRRELEEALTKRD